MLIIQADAIAARAGTPVEARTDKPLGLTLSEIIRKARNEKAREDPIDLTGDDESESVAQPTDTSADDPQLRAQSLYFSLFDDSYLTTHIDSPSAPPPTESTAAPPPETLQPAPHLDLIRFIREKATSAKRPSGPSQQSAVDLQQSKGKAPPLALPRNFRRISAPSGTGSSSVQLPPVPLETAGPSPSSTQDPALPSETASGVSSAGALIEGADGSFRHVLPRRNTMRPPHSAPPPITIKIPPLSRPSSAGASPAGTTPQMPGRVEPNARMTSDPVVLSEQAATPLMSPTEMTDEEECRRSLLYPSTTPEDSPAVEVRGQYICLMQ